MSAESTPGALPTLRVVHVITSMANGGAERQLELLLDRSAHATTVVCLYDAGPVADDVRAKGHEVLVLGMAGWRKAAAVPRLAALLRRLRPDVVHVHLLAAQLWGVPAARLARVPVVVSTEHSLMADTIEGRPHSWWLRSLYRALEAMTTRTVAVSATTADRLVAWGVRRERITVVDNGIDLDALAPDPVARAATRAAWGVDEDTTVLLALGRLDRVKRVDEVITAAAPRLRAGGHRLVVVGAGSLLPSLRELAEELDVTDEVVFTGPRSDVPALLGGADVMLSASRDETFGLAVLEAVAAGLPVAYAAAPALEELDEAIPTAVHVGPGPTALAGGLAQLLPTGRGAPRPRGEVPDQVRRRYGADATAAALDALYVELASAPQAPHLAADPHPATRRVVLASRGDALTRYLATALERRYEISARIDPELPQWQRLLVAATTFRPRRNAWMERFYKSSLAYRLRTAHGNRAVRALRASGAMTADDPVVQVHALFELNGVRDLQYVDCTHRQSAEHWPAWNPLRGRALEHWYAREGRAYRGAHHLFAFSRATRDSLVDHYDVDPGRVSVVGAGVNLDALPPVRSAPAPGVRRGGPVVLMVGNDFERKGGSVLLTAFAAVRAAHPGARLVLIGTDPQIGTPPPGVEVLGRVHDRQVVMDAYAAADVFALPAVFDPFPLVLLEAMAYGVPVVTSRSCGIPDVITDGVDGVMVDPPSTERLAAALLAVIDDPERAARLGAAGRARVESTFTWDHVVARMAPVIDGGTGEAGP